MYTLSRTMLQTDEGYNMLPIPALSIFRVILLSFGKNISGAANFFFFFVLEEEVEANQT